MSINKKYEDWDCIIVQINRGDEGLGNVRMMRQDLETMAEAHGSDRGSVMEMMLQALEEEHKNRESSENDAVSERL